MFYSEIILKNILRTRLNYNYKVNGPLRTQQFKENFRLSQMYGVEVSMEISIPQMATTQLSIQF